MSSFALVLLLAAAASAASVPGPAPGAEPAGPGHIRSFALFGHPAAAAGAAGIRGAVDVEDIPINELGGWRSVYEKPIVVAVKKADKPEIAAFLAKDGLAGLAKSPETRPLHELLKTGEEKVGIMLSAAKFLSAPEFDLPIPKVVYPKGVTLATAARAQAESNGYPWVLVAPQSELKTTELAKLALVGDFAVTENAVKVASDIPSPADASPVARFAGIDASPMHMHYGLEPESASAGETTITIRTGAGAPFPAMIRAFPTLSKFAPASGFASTKFAASSPKYVLVPEFAPAAAKFAPSTKYVLIPEYASEYAPNAQFAPSTKYALAPEFAPAPYAIAARHPALAGAAAALESDAPAAAYLTMRSGHSKRFTADPAAPIAAEPATAGSAPSRSAHPEHSPAKSAHAENAHAENAPARAAAAAAAASAPTAGAPMPGSAASHA